MVGWLVVLVCVCLFFGGDTFRYLRSRHSSPACGCASWALLVAMARAAASRTPGARERRRQRGRRGRRRGRGRGRAKGREGGEEGRGGGGGWEEGGGRGEKKEEEGGKRRGRRGSLVDVGRGTEMSIV